LGAATVRSGRAASGLPPMRLRCLAKASPVAPCPMPLGHHVEASVQERITADVPLDLAAGGLGDTPGAHEHNRVDEELMLAGHVAADRLDHLGRLHPLATLQLEDDHQLL